MTSDGGHSPRNSVFHWLSMLLWRALVTGVLLLALYVIAARALMYSIAPWKDQLLAELNTRLPFTLEAGELEGSLQGFSPQVLMRELTVRFEAPEQTPITLAAGSLRLDPLRSLLALAPHISELQLQGIDVQVARSPDGVLRLAGFQAGIGLLRAWMREFLARVDVLQVDSGRVVLRDAAGDLVSAAGVELDLRRSGSARTLETRLSIPGNRIRVQARGVGDPLTAPDWRGDVYLHLEGDRLERILAWAPRGDLPLDLSGGGSLEAWLSRAGGRSDISLRARGENLVIVESGGGWRLPLQTLAMNASLSQIQGGWRLQASDLAVAHDGREWRVPRARFQLLGDSLSARVAGMQLDGIEHLLAAAPATSDTLARALEELRPRGFLSAAELSLDDVRSPGKGWRFAARVDGAALDSWRGAPGVQGLAALVELEPGGGRVVVDGRDLRLSFPTVYREPLNYDELYGEMSLAWDDRGVTVDSDLMTARGAEGMARAVFRLDFPRREDVVGPSMNLLVGLRDSEARYRVKYLPFTLPGGVARWLEDSVGDGRIEKGGFIWRGSLRRRNYDHMTVQMFFDLQDTTIRFDPRWPALSGFSGPVLIDDRRVSIWGDAGSVGGLPLKFLSAEMDRRADGETELAVSARVVGDASLGLDLVRASPLSTLAGGALDGWQASGPLQADLGLRVPVSRASPPVDIDFEAVLNGVDLDIRPGRLPLRGLQGSVAYRSDGGFAGSEVTGTLWEKPVRARYAAQAETPGALSLALEGAVAADPLLEWLGRQPGILEGEGAVNGDLVITPGGTSTLSLASTLEGMSLDLPAPWGKARDELRRLELQLRFSSSGSDLDVSLDNTLSAALRLAGGDLVGGNLALESQWLQAVYSPTSSPPLLVDWIDLDGMRDAVSMRPGAAAGKNAAEGGQGLYRFLSQSPATDVQVLEIRRGNSSSGHLAFRFESDGSALYARDISGDFFGLRSEAGGAGGTEMRWSVAGDGDFSTALDIDLGFDDLGTVFTAFGYAPVIESRSGAAVGSLRWPGSPRAPQFDQLQGTLQVQAREGRLRQSPGAGASGALKVVTLLNLAELLQGLNLASMFETGIPFERASSDLVFNRGQLRIPSLTLDGSASAFRFSGTTNLAAVEGELVVTLPVASNLPWVAALAAGLPVAAGVFVVSKVFEKQVERMSSGVYSVSGPVDSPQVRLKRIFDNTTDVSAEPLNGDADPETDAAAAGEGAQADPVPEDSESSRR